MRTVFINGEYLPEDEAKISIFDRGFLFADSIYEVTTVVNGKLVDFTSHMTRLRRSLNELSMPSPADDDTLLTMHRELIKRNKIDQGLVYMQVSRGVADRSFLYPSQETPATLVAFTQVNQVLETPALADGIKVISVEDQRWARRDIKTTQLLYPSMAKMQAKSQGADDAWLIEDGLVTEGTSNNAFIVTAEGTLVTRPLSNDILHGTTRKALLDCAASMQIKFEERAFTLEEAKHAREAFISSASCFAVPVVSIDGTRVGDGKRGPVTARLQEAYRHEQVDSGI